MIGYHPHGIIGMGASKSRIPALANLLSCRSLFSSQSPTLEQMVRPVDSCPRRTRTDLGSSSNSYWILNTLPRIEPPPSHSRQQLHHPPLPRLHPLSRNLQRQHEVVFQHSAAGCVSLFPLTRIRADRVEPFAGPGSALTIVVGGAAESLSARPGTADLTLKRRMGFIKLAMRQGADLVPVFSFGENDVSCRCYTVCESELDLTRCCR